MYLLEQQLYSIGQAQGAYQQKRSSRFFKVFAGLFGLKKDLAAAGQAICAEDYVRVQKINKLSFAQARKAHWLLEEEKSVPAYRRAALALKKRGRFVRWLFGLNRLIASFENAHEVIVRHSTAQRAQWLLQAQPEQHTEDAFVPLVPEGRQKAQEVIAPVIEEKGMQAEKAKQAAANYAPVLRDAHCGFFPYGGIHPTEGQRYEIRTTHTERGQLASERSAREQQIQELKKNLVKLNTAQKAAQSELGRLGKIAEGAHQNALTHWVDSRSAGPTLSMTYMPCPMLEDFQSEEAMRAASNRIDSLEGEIRAAEEALALATAAITVLPDRAGERHVVADMGAARWTERYVLDPATGKPAEGKETGAWQVLGTDYSVKESKPWTHERGRFR